MSSIRINKEYKPSFHRANARHRGVTELSQYTNFVLEVTHDVLFASNVTTGNEILGMMGHENEIRNNFVSIMTGSEEVGRANIPTATTLKKVERGREISVPSLQNWQPVNGASVVQNGDEFTISSQGISDPVGISTSLFVNPGDAIFIRFQIKSTDGAPDFSFGSNNIRMGWENGVLILGDTRKLEIPANEDFMYVDYIIRSGHSETISLNINAHEEPEVLEATNITIKNLEVYYIKEQNLNVTSFREGIAPILNEVEEDVNSIRIGNL